jgi:class 3 adenylate cyclase
MMAFFGAPNKLQSPEKSALSAAQDMLAALQELNRNLHKENIAPLQIGVGLHSGDAVIGYIGSEERHEYTAIGDTVNIASRLEGLCKQLHYPIICSAALVNRLDDASMLDMLGEHPVKGHSPIMVYGCRPAVQ